MSVASWKRLVLRRTVEERCVGTSEVRASVRARMTQQPACEMRWRVDAHHALAPVRVGLRRSLQTSGGRPMQVRDGMSELVLTLGPGHTLRQAATHMARRKVGAAVVLDPDGEGPGILTERDILLSVAEGQDPDAECVSEHLTADVVLAAPDWSLEQAA